MRDYTYIEQLLASYLAGDTTAAEEAVLRAFYRQPEQQPAALEQYRTLFAPLPRPAVPEALAQRLRHITQAAPQAARGLKPAQTPQAEACATPQAAPQAARRYTLRPLYRAAASVAVVLALAQAAQMPYASQQSERERVAEAAAKAKAAVAAAKQRQAEAELQADTAEVPVATMPAISTAPSQ